MIVVGSVVFVTAIVLVVVIILHRKKPKIKFETKDGGKEAEDILFQKTMNADLTLDPKRNEDGETNHMPIRSETSKIEDIVT